MNPFPAPRFVRRVAILLTTMLLAAPLPAAADVSFFSTGAGKFRCDAYLQASQGLSPGEFKLLQKGPRNYVSESSPYDHWIYGFVSALNLGSAWSGGKKPDVQARNAEIIGWIRNWCSVHQDAAVMDGVLGFMTERWAQGRRN